MNTVSKGFYPIYKSNYKRFEIVNKNGSVKSRIALNIIVASLREQIICKHFLSRYVMWFIRELTPIRYLSRDKPWDFIVDLGCKETLKIELTAVSDNEAQFSKMKYEDRIAGLTDKKTIPFHELQKMQYAFPNKETFKLIEERKKLGDKNDTLIENPFYESKEFVFFSNISESNDNFSILLKLALEKKMGKNHPDKEEVIIIIDNRTILFDQNDILKAIEELDVFLDELPFKEVWIYTGYYSDLDGNNSEYSLFPIKISDEKYKTLKSLVQKQ